jgi:hypothetical protein
MIKLFLYKKGAREQSVVDEQTCGSGAGGSESQQQRRKFRSIAKVCPQFLPEIELAIVDGLMAKGYE